MRISGWRGKCTPSPSTSCDPAGKTHKSTELGLRLSVKYRVVDARTQEILYAGSAEEVGQFFDQGNIQSARTNALSYAARLVATSIAETLTNG